MIKIINIAASCNRFPPTACFPHVLGMSLGLGSSHPWWMCWVLTFAQQIAILWKQCSCYLLFSFLQRRKWRSRVLFNSRWWWNVCWIGKIKQNQLKRVAGKSSFTILECDNQCQMPGHRLNSPSLTWRKQLLKLWDATGGSFLPQRHLNWRNY